MERREMALRKMNYAEKFHVSICKQILGLLEHVYNPIVSSELFRIAFLMPVETQMFKYFQRLPFLKENISYSTWRLKKKCNKIT